MIILENANLSTDTIVKILEFAKDKFNKGEYTFSETIDGVHFWCDDDLEHTVFFEGAGEDGYAALNEEELKDDIQECAEAVKYQIDNTIS